MFNKTGKILPVDKDTRKKERRADKAREDRELDELVLYAALKNSIKTQS